MHRKKGKNSRRKKEKPLQADFESAQLVLVATQKPCIDSFTSYTGTAQHMVTTQQMDTYTGTEQPENCSWMLDTGKLMDLVSSLKGVSRIVFQKGTA